MMTANNAAEAISIDGYLDDWSPSLLHSDPIGDNYSGVDGQGADMDQWGVTLENGYLCVAIKAASTITPLSNLAKYYASVWIDADRNQSTYIAKSDQEGKWKADIYAEYGSDQGFNFWGYGHEDGDTKVAVTDGSYAINGNAIEFRVSLTELATQTDVVNSGYGVTLGSTFDAGVRFAGKFVDSVGGSNYVGDIGSAMTTVPEPNVLTLLTIGVISALGYAWRRRM